MLACQHNEAEDEVGLPSGAYRILLNGSATALLLVAGTVRAQDLEPRAYSASPTGTNFMAVNYARLSGAVLTDPSLPITNVAATIKVASLGYVRTFGLFGRFASFGVVVPCSQGDMSGEVFDAPREVHRAGFGDVRARFALNLLGPPAMTPLEFGRRQPRASLGTSLSIIAPTGKYVPAQLINVGSNRWAFKPEIGLSQPIGRWFVEASAGIWLFGDNDEFFGSKRRGQDPMTVLQLHGGYNFRPGLWLAADLGRYAGGRTKLNGISNQDRQQNTRYGLMLSAPLATGWSGKVSWSRGWTTRAGGDFDTVSVTLQYRWFDH